MTTRNAPSDPARTLTATHEIRVRFNETDAMGIVWHGNYLVYFEEGREAFGRQYGISYLDVMAHGYGSPIVKSVVEHKLPLKYGDIARMEVRYTDCDAAKAVFDYTIYTPDGRVACIGSTTQVFLDSEGQMALYPPDFIVEWKKRVGLRKG